MADLEMPQIGEDPPQEKFLGDYATREEAEKALAELRAEKETLRARAEQADRLQAQLDTVLTTRQPEAPRYVPPKQELEFPDPVADPEGHKRAMREFQRRIEEDMSHQKAEIERKDSERQAKEFADGLWSDFRNRYSAEGLDDEDIVNTIAGRELQSIRAAGGDPQRYIMQNRDAFLDRVASGVRSKISRYREKEPNRTAGVAGGTTAPSHDKQEPKVSSFMDQLKDARTQAERAFR